MVRRLILISALMACVTAYAVDILWLDMTQPIELSGGTWRNVPTGGGVTGWNDPFSNNIVGLWYGDQLQIAAKITMDPLSITNGMEIMSDSAFLPRYMGQSDTYLRAPVNQYFKSGVSVGDHFGATASNISFACYMRNNDPVTGAGGLGHLGLLNNSYNGFLLTDRPSVGYAVYINTVQEATWLETDTNNFHLVTGTYDGINARIYGDGVFRAAGANTTIFDMTSKTFNAAVYYGNRYTFNGEMAWFMLWNRTITSNENAILWANKDAIAVDTISTNGIVMAGFLLSNTWSLADSGAGYRHAIAYPTIGTSGTFGAGGWTNALGTNHTTISYTDGQYFRVKIWLPTQPGTNSLMISALINPSIVGGANRNFFSTSRGATDDRITLYTDTTTGKLIAQLRTDATSYFLPSDAIIPTNEWTHVCLERNSGVKTALWINGVEQASNVVESLNFSDAVTAIDICGAPLTGWEGRVGPIRWYNIHSNGFAALLYSKTFPANDVENRIYQ